MKTVATTPNIAGPTMLRVTWYFRSANQWKNLPIRVIAVQFVYSIKARQRFHNHAKRTYRVFARFTSLLFAMRASTVATASKKATMITFTHILTLSFLRWKGLHFLLSIINKLNCDFFHWQFFHLLPPEKPRDIAFIPSVLECVQRWRVSLIRSINARVQG